MIWFARSPIPAQPSRDELERQWAERDRIWLEERERCRCSRPIADRRYLGRTCCRRCTRWIPRRAGAAA